MTSNVDEVDRGDAGHEVRRGPKIAHPHWAWRVDPSSVTLKLVMAVTGIVFSLYVLVHMIGNLKVYTGPADFDAYAHWLRTLLEPLLPYEGLLWIFRTFLLICLVAHVGCAVLLTRRAHVARGRFRRRGLGLRSFTARTMLVTGVVLLLFIVFHILDLTVGVRPFASTSFTPTTETSSDAYANLVASFSRPGVAVFYLLAMAVLGAHLVHGLWTVVNDLGVTGQRARQVCVTLGGLLALAVMVGNMTIPIAVWVGLVQ
ncbi:succinate dehydrogenase cytochrome b subunit [Mycolicibacterium mengxianglii]|uniref:succinate dehydrogenase cytochrome b subunit n=1 Tax=Mycolicibacterium mengxianglii TaxID=2736649 RepID=UPI0018D076A4|nr:succinate dehydrogenase cytochrome b subunit [Mycolicibacterium mengxianglii]